MDFSPNSIINLIPKLISKVLVNGGRCYELFQSQERASPGATPLSPMLFIIAIDVLQLKVCGSGKPDYLEPNKWKNTRLYPSATNS